MLLVEKILVVLAAVAAMEFIAWASHKYIMHGFGWGWHRDHHQRHDGFFEKNDLYALVGAAMSISMFAVGSPLVLGANAWEPATWIGIGILVYGVIYTLIHDGLVHQRWFRYVPRRGYLKRVVQAHNLHHVTHGRHGGVSFGFVIARHPDKLKQELMRQKRRGEADLRRSRQLNAEESRPGAH
ncbi:sterol desaturase family protein [Croceicoccus sp. BE223]|uniref:sterol desaturase family protein n=1 Tax=Croceicoccus sp. BE223 TaxID=2817716 RepID=UPI002866567A|nr:sterol desaturase family protein [Croceicoccus sp. BE223]MDR7103772.1 beta-carotene 3-hydroxylase [Croceicoccus sp. BE223]